MDELGYYLAIRIFNRMLESDCDGDAMEIIRQCRFSLVENIKSEDLLVIQELAN